MIHFILYACQLIHLFFLNAFRNTADNFSGRTGFARSETKGAQGNRIDANGAEESEWYLKTALSCVLIISWYFSGPWTMRSRKAVFAPVIC